MLFSSLFFLFAFLPVTLVGYLLLRTAPARNAFLLLASLFFYAWGEPSYLLLMASMIVINYLLAIAVESAKPFQRKVWLCAAATINLTLLAWFKYSDFFIFNFNWLQDKVFHRHHPIPLLHVTLPLGISFVVFHCLSYIIDIYRGKAQAQKSPVKLGLYLTLFPQLIAGPIIRYHEIWDQLSQRLTTAEKFAGGVRRFVIGLGKKMLVANVMARVADSVFALPASELSTAISWLGAVSYTLQIYFDFSGYSDMAIGLGLMFGFKFPENFNFPYTAQSIREFWRRWHITLSNWFRDYLYVPLGGNRHGDVRTCLNLLCVFFLCGLWHGASWTFVIWGLYHGAFLGIERSGFGVVLEKLWRPFRHAYALVVVMVGWVIFRSSELAQASAILCSMFGFAKQPVYSLPIEHYLTGDAVLALTLGIAASTTVFTRFIWEPRKEFAFTPALRLTGVTAIFLLSIAELASSSYNPFIYFRF